MGREYRKLVAWQRADELVMAIYGATKTFPREEMYGLTAQLRRAALSVPTNIAEGMARRTAADKAHFLIQAEASLSEVGYLLDVAHRLGFMTQEAHTRTLSLHEATARPLFGLARKIEERGKVDDS